MSAHTKRSPSQADKFAVCPGALALCEALPDHQKNISSAAARLGTCAHFLIETCLKDHKTPESFQGRVIAILNENSESEQVKILSKSAKTPTNTPWFEIDDDMIEGVSMMLDHVHARMTELKALSPELELESRTNPLPDRDDTSGTADITIHAWPALLEIADYKNGYNVVELTTLQLRAYLLGKAIEDDFSSALYRITVVQPNAPHDDGRVRSLDMTADELQAFGVTYRAQIERCEVAERDKGAPVKVADLHDVDSKWAKKHLVASADGKKDHCMFCDAKPVCPAYIGRRQQQAAMDFEDEPEQLPRSYDADSASKILRWEPYFNALFAATRMWTQRNLENGFKVKGWKLSYANTNRKLIETMQKDELATKIASRFQIARADLFSDSMKTGPQIEKLIPKDQRKEFERLFLFKPQGGVVLVPEESKRVEVVKRAGDDFDDDFG